MATIYLDSVGKYGFSSPDRDKYFIRMRKDSNKEIELHTFQDENEFFKFVNEVISKSETVLQLNVKIKE